MVTMADMINQGAEVDADLCDCGHDRGSHWNGTINCGYCGCQDFAFAGCPRCPGTLTHAADCDGAGR